jgi:hypothetical protein
MRVAGRLRFALLEHRAQLAVRDRAAHLPRSLSAGHVRRPARMLMARLERWEAEDAKRRADRFQPGNPDARWRLPRFGEAGVADCRRLYAMLTARVPEAQLQCATPRRQWFR